jgi:two-component system, OmpR family, sensor histidine kinase KdpD
MSGPRTGPIPVPEHGGEPRTRLLLELATRVTRSLDLQDVLDEAFRALRQLLDFGGGAIQLIDDGALVAAATDPPMAPEARTVRIPVGQGVSGTIAATGEPIYIPDITIDERVHPDGRKKGVSSGVRSYFGVPLILGGGPIGVVQVDSPEVDAFDADTRTLVLAFVPTIAAAVQNARIFEQERAALTRLEETQRLKDGFISIVSHELRTPLATTLGFADTLAQRVDSLAPEQIADLAGRILRSGQRLQRLIEDLLYASNLERGFLDVALAPTDLAEIIQVVATEAARLDHPVAVSVPDDLPFVLADRDRLHQVITNLVDNAAKFSPEDAVIDVTVTHSPEVGEVSVTVVDRGRGIPPTAQDSVFDLFFQAEDANTRSAGGLGIGLYVVKRLCDAMDAPVTIADREGGGTAITVRLRTAARNTST